MILLKNKIHSLHLSLHFKKLFELNILCDRERFLWHRTLEVPVDSSILMK